MIPSETISFSLTVQLLETMQFDRNAWRAGRMVSGLTWSIEFSNVGPG